MKNNIKIITEDNIHEFLIEKDLYVKNFIKQFEETSVGSWLFYLFKEERSFIEYIKNSKLLLDASGKLINVRTFKSVYKDIFKKMDPVFRIDFNEFVKQLNEFSFGYIKSNSCDDTKSKSYDDIVINNDTDRWIMFRKKLSDINKRDELIACVLFSTKLSVEGVCRIKTENFNTIGNFFFFPKKKGDFKIVPIPRSLSIRINEYIKNKKVDSLYLFSTNTGNAITRSRISFAFKEVVKRNPFLNDPKVTPKYLKKLYRSLYLEDISIDRMVM